MPTTTHDGEVSEPVPERVDLVDDYESWRDLQDVLEERDREYWDEHGEGGQDDTDVE